MLLEEIVLNLWKLVNNKVVVYATTTFTHEVTRLGASDVALTS